MLFTEDLKTREVFFTLVGSKAAESLSPLFVDWEIEAIGSEFLFALKGPFFLPKSASSESILPGYLFSYLKTVPLYWAGIFCSLTERESISQLANLGKTVQACDTNFSFFQRGTFPPSLPPFFTRDTFPMQSELVADCTIGFETSCLNKWVPWRGSHHLIAPSSNLVTREGELFDDRIVTVFIR